MYSVVIPVYNSTTTLEELARRIGRVFDTVTDGGYEIIFVDDASPNPRTWTTLAQIHSAHPHIKIIRLTRNFGQHAATLCGIKQAKGDFIITMDDDLQHLPEDIPALLEMKPHDIVIAQLVHKKHGLFKAVTSFIKGYFDLWIIGKPRGINLSSFRLFNKTIANGILAIQTPYPIIGSLLFYVSKDVIGVPVEHVNRKEGKSGYSFYGMARLFSNLIINNSSLLLKFVGLLGTLMSILSFIVGIIFVYRKMVSGISIVGWTSVIVSILFIGGLLLFSVGVIGEYLVRIIGGTEKKPTYIIRSIKGYGLNENSRE